MTSTFDENYNRCPFHINAEFNLFGLLLSMKFDHPFLVDYSRKLSYNKIVKYLSNFSGFMSTYIVKPERLGYRI